MGVEGRDRLNRTRGNCFIAGPRLRLVRDCMTRHKVEHLQCAIVYVWLNESHERL